MTFQTKASLVILLTGTLGTSCLSMQSQSTLEAVQVAGGSQPYTEAYLEYPGPNEKWAGPASFVLHIVAKDAGIAQVAMTPGWLFPAHITEKGRGLASEHTVSGETAREHLVRLVTAMQSGDQEFSGCLYPIRARLIRADGAIVEKHGCRSPSGWARAASETINNFVTASVYGPSASTRSLAGDSAEGSN